MNDHNKLNTLEMGQDGTRVEIGVETEKEFEIRVHVPKNWSLESALELSLQIQQLYELHRNRNEEKEEVENE